jgi:hypothetical protein
MGFGGAGVAGPGVRAGAVRFLFGEIDAPMSTIRTSNRRLTSGVLGDGRDVEDRA